MTERLSLFTQKIESDGYNRSSSSFKEVET